MEITAIIFSVRQRWQELKGKTKTRDFAIKVFHKCLRVSFPMVQEWNEGEAQPITLLVGRVPLGLIFTYKILRVVGRGSHLSVTRQNDKHKGKEEGHSLYVL